MSHVDSEGRGLDRESIPVTERPEHGDQWQITSVDQLEVGMIVDRVSGGKPGERIMVVTLPQEDKPGYIVIQGEFGDTRDASLADMGVLPYSQDGRWNPTNYIRSVSKLPAN